MIDRDELAAWLRLLETPRVGRDTARRLLAAFGSPQAVFAADADALHVAVGSGVANDLLKPADDLGDRIATAVHWLEGDTPEAPRHIVTLGDPHYPAALLQAADPPLLLYLQGRLDLLQSPAIAIVGSRRPTPQGEENAKAFGAALSQAGWTVVSGLARGVDGAAHEGALSGPGSTIAFVGTGIDRVYPARHRALAHRIAREGLLASEYPLGTPPLAQNFPQRNRLIAGLTSGTLVVEAALKSGSLITARMAVESNREVFAIPGSIHSPQARGCHALIKQGAKLVESAQDILDELRPPASTPAVPPDADVIPDEAIDEHDTLLAAIGFDPVSLDALMARTGWPLAELNVRLLEMELDGTVARLPGQLFQRLARV